MAILWEEKLDSEESSEPHWSASTIMAIFMASCLVTAVFFGLGYSFGRGGTAKSASNTAVASKTSASASQGIAATTSQKPQFREVANVTHSSPTNVQAPTPAPELHLNRPVAKTPVTERAALIPVPERKAVPKPAAKARTTEHTVKTSTNSHYMVQVGAVGNRKDARMLVAQLRRHGIHASIYPGKQDRFLHVQVGPFSTEQQARAMRHHVMANGYHAILKRA